MSSQDGLTPETIDTVRFHALANSKPVSGATMGIVGMGSLGLETAKRARHGFNMKILYHNRTRR